MRLPKLSDFFFFSKIVIWLEKLSDNIRNSFLLFDLNYYFVHINYVFELCVWLRNFSPTEIKIKIVK